MKECCQWQSSLTFNQMVTLHDQYLKLRSMLTTCKLELTIRDWQLLSQEWIKAPLKHFYRKNLTHQLNSCVSSYWSFLTTMITWSGWEPYKLPIHVGLVKQDPTSRYILQPKLTQVDISKGLEPWNIMMLYREGMVDHTWQGQANVIKIYITRAVKQKIHEALKSCDTSGTYFNVGKTLHQTFPSVNWNKKGAQLKKKSLFRTLDS